ncbi:MAG: sortase [Acidimicrobiia bacterium]
MTTSAAAAVAGILIAGLTAALLRVHRPAPQPLREPAVTVQGRRDPATAAIALLRRRPWARRGLSLLSIGLVLAAVGMLGYPFYTNLYQSRVQARLDRQIASPELEQAYRSGQIGTGDALTRIQMPSIDVDVVVVEGTTASALRAGAGHYPTSPLPCEPGNVAIAGHRTTYGRPFHNLDRLGPGDTITLDTPIGSCTYQLREAPFVVQPNDLSVLDPTPEPSITLTTCEPKGSAAKRLIVQAVLVRTSEAPA